MDHVAVDETVIQLDDPRYWLYTAVDPKTAEFLHVMPGMAQTLGLSEIFLRELREKHGVEYLTALSRVGLSGSSTVSSET